MRSLFLKFLVPAMLCLVVTGCGGSSASSGGGGGGGGGNNNPTTVTLKFYDGAPAAVATQIGTGSFTAASVASNTVTLSVPYGTSKFAAAWACAAQVSGQYSSTNEYVIESTTSDATTYNLWCPSPAATVPTGTLTLSVDASAFAETTQNYWTFLLADADNASGFEEGSPSMVSSNFALTAPSGSDRVDLIVTGETVVPGTAYLSLVAIKSFTGVAVPGTLNGGNTVDFTSADAAIMEPITYKNLPAYYNQPATNVLITPSGDNYFIVSDQDATTAYPALPPSIAAAGDSYSVAAESYALVGSGSPPGILELVTAASNFQGEGPVTLTFPAPWTYAGPTPAALPALDLAYSGFSGQNDVVESGLLSWYLPSDFHTSYYYWMGASSGYLNGTATLKFPDLTQISGFIPNPVSGAQLNWEGDVCQGGTGVGQLKPSIQTVACVEAAASYVVP